MRQFCEDERIRREEFQDRYARFVPEALFPQLATAAETSLPLSRLRGVAAMSAIGRANSCSDTMDAALAEDHAAFVEFYEHVRDRRRRERPDVRGDAADRCQRVARQLPSC